jgi:hypothetical protein
MLWTLALILLVLWMLRSHHLVHGRWVDPHPAGGGLGRCRRSSFPVTQVPDVGTDGPGNRNAQRARDERKQPVSQAAQTE